MDMNEEKSQAAAQEGAAQEGAQKSGVTRAAFLNVIAGAACFGVGTLAGKAFFGGSSNDASSSSGEGSAQQASTDASADAAADAVAEPAATGDGASAEDLLFDWDKEEAGQELMQVGANTGSSSSSSGGADETDLTDESLQPFESVWCVREDAEGDMNIFGLKFVPEGDGPFPTVICAHGITGMCFNFFDYANYLSQNGYLVYAFDFCGGNYEDNAQSDGEFIDMTINSEMADLKAVFEEVRTWDDVDTDNIFLMGHSQGGLVSSLVAGDVMDDINGLILIAPGYELVDMVRSKYPNRADIPEMFEMFGTFMVGQAYGQSLWDLNWQVVIERFTKPVLLLHGTKDSVIQYRYSVEAAENFEDAQIELFPNQGHWLEDESFDRSCVIILDFLNEFTEDDGSDAEEDDSEE